MERNFVLLAYANASPFPYHSWTPLSILTLGAYLEKHGIEVEYFDQRIHRERRFKELLRRRPLLVGLSTMTCFQIKNTLKLARLVRKINPEIPIVWGGTHPSMCAEQTLESNLVDFVIKGEQTLLELLHALKNDKNGFGEIDGLGWKKNGKCILNKDTGFLNIEDLPFPYEGEAEERLLEYIRRSEDTLENIGYESSRGCPHRCGFCYNEFFHKNVCRVKSLDKIRAELIRLKELGVEKMTFYDDTFLAGRSSMMNQVCDLLKELNFKWIAKVRINTFTPELLKKFEESGCVYLFFGVESPDDEVLKYQKGVK